MYIQLTTRCNMRCRHCGYSCTEQGEDMSREVFFKAVKLCRSLSWSIDLGGGEPTLHPLFWDFIGLCLGYLHRTIHVTTNGKLARDAIRLAGLARDGVLSVDLSRDEYHEEIEPSVETAFRTGVAVRDRRGIRDVTAGGTLSPIATGRASGWANTEHNRCIASIPTVVTDGTIFSCGCKEVKYGTVFRPELPPHTPVNWCSSGFEQIRMLDGEPVIYSKRKLLDT